MPTPQLKWPTEVESQRKEALEASMEAMNILREAQMKVDRARDRVHSNQVVARMLLADAARLNADSQICLEQIQMYLSVARATPLKGRWGVGAAAKREDSDHAAKAAVLLIEKILEQIEVAQEKLHRNSELAEMIIAKLSQWQAQTLVHMARIERLLTEASFGR